MCVPSATVPAHLFYLSSFPSPGSEKTHEKLAQDTRSQILTPFLGFEEVPGPGRVGSSSPFFVKLNPKYESERATLPKTNR